MRIKRKYLTLLNKGISFRKKFKIVEWNLRNHELDGPFPLFAQIEIERSCNLNCSYCIRGDLPSNKNRLTVEEFGNVLDMLPGSVTMLSYQGWGEPMLNPDYFDVLELAAKRGYKSAIITNGTLLSDDNILRLLALDPLKIGISIFHPRREDVVAKAKRLIELRDASGYDTYVYLIATVVPENIEDLFLTDDIQDETGVDGIYVNTCFTDQLYSVKPVRMCHAPKSSMFIAVNGDTWACSCSVTEEPAGNIYKESIMDIYKEGFKRWRDNENPPDCCLTCESYGLSLEGI